jgi:hypothetical protein
MQKSIVVLCAVFGLAGPVGAQDLYDYDCCPKADCHSAVLDRVTMTLEGYHVDSLDTVVAQDDPRIRPSRDGRFHICTRSKATPDMSDTSVGALMGKRVLKCLYVPTSS